MRSSASLSARGLAHYLFVNRLSLVSTVTISRIENLDDPMEASQKRKKDLVNELGKAKIAKMLGDLDDTDNFAEEEDSEDDDKEEEDDSENDDDDDEEDDDSEAAATEGSDDSEEDSDDDDEEEKELEGKKDKVEVRLT